MIRLLFVDDDADVLAGLRNRLRPQRSRWDMVFVESGFEALEELERAPFDVVISDMRMPIMDGAELLTQIKERHPDVARIVLSGDAEREAVLRALPIVHQFLSKPCDGNVLRAAIERVCLLRSILRGPRLRELLQTLERPPLPASYRTLVRAMGDARNDGADLARLLTEDPRLNADVTRLAAAAGLGSLETLTPLALQSLTLAAALFAPVAGDAPSLAELARRALWTARLARGLTTGRHADAAFAAGLLRHVGELVLRRALPERGGAPTDEAAGTFGPTNRQREALGALSPSELGAALLSEWAVAPAVVEAVALCERTEVQTLMAPEVLTALQVAAALADGAECDALEAGLRQRADAQMPHWRGLAAQARALRS